MEIPSKVKTYHTVWDIELVDKKTMKKLAGADDYAGLVRYTHEKIYLLETMATGLMKTTLLHEIMHACIFNNRGTVCPDDNSFETWEHYFIGTLEYSLIDVLKNNPEIVTYLISEEK